MAAPIPAILLVLLTLLAVMSTPCLKMVFGRGEEAPTRIEDKQPVKIPTGESHGEVDDSNIRQSMAQLQALQLPREERRSRNKKFVKSLKVTRGDYRTAFIWMKASLDPATCNKILQDFDHSGSVLERVVDWCEDRVDGAKKTSPT